MATKHNGQDAEQDSDPPRTMIGVKAATILYLLLCAASIAVLTGKALALALIIVLGIAAKSYLHYWKARRDLR